MPVTPRVPIQTPMFDEDGNMTRTWVIFLERLGQWTNVVNAGDTRVAQKATFGLLRPLATLTDDLTNHYIARAGGKFRNWTCNAKVPPTGQAAILDIQRSVDEGVSWFSIFDTDNNLKINIPAGDSTRIDGTAFKADDPATAGIIEGRIDGGDFLRIDCIQAGNIEPGRDIEVVLQWWEDA